MKASAPEPQPTCHMPKINNLKNIREIRHHRFQELRTEFANSPGEVGVPLHGSLRRFAIHCAMSERYLSHINVNNKAIGHAKARELEAAMGKPVNWMDTPEADSTSEAEKLIQVLALRAYRTDQIKTHEALLKIVAGDA